MLMCLKYVFLCFHYRIVVYVYTFILECLLPICIAPARFSLMPIIIVYHYYFSQVYFSYIPTIFGSHYVYFSYMLYLCPWICDLPINAPYIYRRYLPHKLIVIISFAAHTCYPYVLVFTVLCFYLYLSMTLCLNWLDKLTQSVDDNIFSVEFC